MEVLSKRINVLREISNMLKDTFYIVVSNTRDIMPKNKGKSYGVSVDNVRIFFDNKSSLNKYIKLHAIDKSKSFKVELVNDNSEYDNVIRVISGNSIELYSMIDSSSYFKHNREKSLERQRPIWEFKYGNISDYYEALGKEKRLIR